MLRVQCTMREVDDLLVQQMIRQEDSITPNLICFPDSWLRYGFPLHEPARVLRCGGAITYFPFLTNRIKCMMGPTVIWWTATLLPPIMVRSFRHGKWLSTREAHVIVMGRALTVLVLWQTREFPLSSSPPHLSLNHFKIYFYC